MKIHTHTTGFERSRRRTTIDSIFFLTYQFQLLRFKRRGFSSSDSDSFNGRSKSSASPRQQPKPIQTSVDHSSSVQILCLLPKNKTQPRKLKIRIKNEIRIIIEIRNQNISWQFRIKTQKNQNYNKKTNGRLINRSVLAKVPSKLFPQSNEESQLVNKIETQRKQKLHLRRLG